MNEFQRLVLNIGEESFKKLQNSTILIVGIGGVGSFAAEAIARAGVKKMILVDKDVVDITNINRQLVALHSTIGISKVEVMKNRIYDINSGCNVVAINGYYDEVLEEEIFKEKIDFVIDCCDTISAKFLILKKCIEKDIPFILSMGAANKHYPHLFQISKLDKTSYDPLARILRKKVKDNRINGKIPVVYSTEEPSKFSCDNTPTSNSFTPSVCGLLCASFVINSIIKGEYDFGGRK